MKIKNLLILGFLGLFIVAMKADELKTETVTNTVVTVHRKVSPVVYTPAQLDHLLDQVGHDPAITSDNVTSIIVIRRESPAGTNFIVRVTLK